MLGVNRPGVTTVAVTLQGAGFIKYSRGLITLLTAKESKTSPADAIKPSRMNMTACKANRF